jgi:hypothetical protein
MIEMVTEEMIHVIGEIPAVIEMVTEEMNHEMEETHVVIEMTMGEMEEIPVVIELTLGEMNRGMEEIPVVIAMITEEMIHEIEEIPVVVVMITEEMNREIGGTHAAGGIPGVIEMVTAETLPTNGGIRAVIAMTHETAETLVMLAGMTFRAVGRGTSLLETRHGIRRIHVMTATIMAGTGEMIGTIRAEADHTTRAMAVEDREVAVVMDRTAETVPPVTFIMIPGARSQFRR